MQKEDLVLNNLQGLISHKIQPTKQPSNQPTHTHTFAHTQIYTYIIM